MKRITLHIMLWASVLIAGCGPSKKFTRDYYSANKETLQSIRTRFREIYVKHPFALEIKDKQMNRIGLEIITDSIKLIYAFDTYEPNLLDTLVKYDFDVKEMAALINDMQRAHCTWITNLDYYENGVKKYLVFVSVRHKELEAFMKPEKYFTLAFFDQPQPIDDKRRLLDRADKKQLRKINGLVFRSIDQRAFFSLAPQFR